MHGVRARGPWPRFPVLATAIDRSTTAAECGIKRREVQPHQPAPRAVLMAALPGLALRPRPMSAAGLWPWLWLGPAGIVLRLWLVPAGIVLRLWLGSRGSTAEKLCPELVPEPVTALWLWPLFAVALWHGVVGHVACCPRARAGRLGGAHCGRSRGALRPRSAVAAEHSGWGHGARSRGRRALWLGPLSAWAGGAGLCRTVAAAAAHRRAAAGRKGAPATRVAGRPVGCAAAVATPALQAGVQSARVRAARTRSAIGQVPVAAGRGRRA
mmetsp:Transcript_40027/g.95749  ORF Transcript_40027/g.95749 Transcript_40027/m.95749 type:complete len:269 (-) Transcript_40027:440-1246(-)